MSAWGEFAGGTSAVGRRTGYRPHRHLFRRHPAPVSRPEGQGFLLAAADAALVHAALADATAYRRAVMRSCDECWSTCRAIPTSPTPRLPPTTGSSLR